MKQEYDAILSDWQVVDIYGMHCLRGRVYNDKKDRFERGEMIKTSPLEYIDFANKIAKTKNSIYKLDEI